MYEYSSKGVSLYLQKSTLAYCEYLYQVRFLQTEQKAAI